MYNIYIYIYILANERVCGTVIVHRLPKGDPKRGTRDPTNKY